MLYSVWYMRVVADRAFHVLYNGHIDDMEIAQDLTVVLVAKPDEFWVSHPSKKLSMEELHQLVLDSRKTERGQRAWEEARYAHSHNH